MFVLNFDCFLVISVLTVCITAGYVVTNRSENRIAFLNLLGSWGPYVFIPFFTKVGAELDLVGKW